MRVLRPIPAMPAGGGPVAETFTCGPLILMGVVLIPLLPAAFSCAALSR